ncbi:hypothetical protein LSTR_LSTR002312 [Laodelphax striatellus]|uniref:DUF1736 domain-containing protein n=1 Tax=Laodelphax striatellus TaxID=195883 RepID=A0A482XGD5_LAOST|nr:hypothetical protein LSTR_LSTR002312 [Laodelphax striatellus]
MIITERQEMAAHIAPALLIFLLPDCAGDHPIIAGWVMKSATLSTFRAVLSNPDVQWTTPLRGLLMDDFWGTPLSSASSHGSYRPLCTLSFRLNHWAGGFRPFGYHLVNVLLHVIATGLVYKTAKLLLPGSAPTCAALLFAAHPRRLVGQWWLFSFSLGYGLSVSIGIECCQSNKKRSIGEAIGFGHGRSVRNQLFQRFCSDSRMSKSIICSCEGGGCASGGGGIKHPLSFLASFQITLDISQRAACSR